MLKLNYFLADIFILSAEKQPIKLSWRKIEWLQMKTTGTPCSCWMCRGFEYDRKEYKKETLRIIRESME